MQQIALFCLPDQYEPDGLEETGDVHKIGSETDSSERSEQDGEEEGLEAEILASMASPAPRCTQVIRSRYICLHTVVTLLDSLFPGNWTAEVRAPF